MIDWLRDDPPKVCARCARPVRLPWQKPAPEHRGKRVWVAVRRWPDGYICAGCFATACETYGRCTACKIDRLVPGIADSGDRLCTDCAGGLGDYTCRRCGEEGWREHVGICGRCVLRDRLAEVLDDGTGRVRPELAPFYEQVSAMSRARSGILWLNKPHVPPILRALAHGDVPLTHEGLSALTPWRSVIYVRDLLISSGVLPPVDRFLFLFEQWLPTWLDSIDDPEHRSVLAQFGTWHLLRHLRTTAERAPIGPYRNVNSRSQLRQSAAFLLDLAAHDRGLGDCTQADIDRWFATASRAEQDRARPFLSWAIRRHLTRRLRLPPVVRTIATPITQTERLRLIRRVHDDDSIPLQDRVVALLILLYAQPLIKIARLTVADVELDAGEVRLRLGVGEAVPIIPPFSTVLLDHIATRSNQTTATNPASTLLFPGRRAGQPIHPGSLRLRLHRLGIPNVNGRTRAIRELLIQAPPAVVASLLGYHPARAELLAAEAGATWKRYAPGDHARHG
jgi:hypothetical protein